MSPRLRPLLLFLLLLVLFPAMAVAVQAAEQGWAGLAPWQWLLLAALPLLAWLWLRHFSILACLVGKPDSRPGPCKTDE